MNLLPTFTGTPEFDRVYHCDLFTLCDALAPQSVDCILCDLPYGTTACAWDTVIPFEPMWARFKRVIKPRGAIVLTASQPFTSALVMSNPRWFKHEWIWRKSSPSGFQNAKFKPMNAHESVIVFADSTVRYFPQKRHRVIHGRPAGGPAVTTTNGIKTRQVSQPIEDDNGYPISVLNVNSCNHAGEAGLHPTQKPVALFEYLIRTYTRPGDLVLDPCVGSGTTAIAARNTQRRFICGDLSHEYVEVARKRLAQPYTMPLFAETA